MWEELAAAVATALGKLGLNSIAENITVDAVKSVAAKEGIAFLRNFVTNTRGHSLNDILEVFGQYAAGAAGRGGVATGKFLLGEDNPIANAASQVKNGALGFAYIVNDKASQASANFYFDTLLGFKNATTPQELASAAAKHIAVLKAINSPVGRFARTATNRFALDASVMLGTRELQKLVDNTKAYKKSSREEKRLIDIFISTAAYTGLNSAAQGLRTKYPTLESVSSTGTRNLGHQLASSAQDAKAYYGDYYPEVAGNIVGSAGALFAINRDPQKTLKTLGIRGGANALIGAYNFGKPKKQQISPVKKVSKVKKTPSK